MTLADYEAFLRNNVPMIKFSGLSLETVDEQQCIVKMPFIAENKNHVQSMYLGSLVIGAEVSAGILAFHLIHTHQINSTVVFKNFSGAFLKLALNDVYFICADASAINAALDEIQTTGKRVNVDVNVIAVEDRHNTTEPIATFTMTVSMKPLSTQ